MTRHAFPVRAAAGCPRRANKGHRFVPDGDSADLLAYGRPDHGVTVFLGRCRDCGIALLSVGRRGSDHPAHLTVLELPDAALPED